MASRKKPTEKVQGRINKVFSESKSNKKAVDMAKKAITEMLVATDGVRSQINDHRIFAQKLFLECHNRVEVLGQACEEFRTIDEDIFKALEEGKTIDVGSSIDAESGKRQDEYSGVGKLNVAYDEKTKLIMKVAKDGSKTLLTWKELLAVKRYIFGANAKSIDAGHETSLATQKIDVVLNILAQLKALAPDPELKAAMAKIETACRAVRKLLIQIDKLKADILRDFSARGITGGTALVNEFITWCLQNPGQVDFGVSSTDATDFQADALSKETVIEYEDGVMNKTKGDMSKTLMTGLQQYAFNILEGTEVTSKTAKIVEDISFVEAGNSLSMVQAVEQNILHKAIGKRYRGPKKKHKPVRDTRPLLKRAKKLNLDPKVNRGVPRPLKKKDAFTEVGRIMGFINAKLPQQVISNMGRPSLQNQTGRFAQSAKVTSALPATGGGIVFNYQYDDRYKGFENNSKYPLEYDPRGIIGKSIRELAATQAEFKFITRRV